MNIFPKYNRVSQTIKHDHSCVWLLKSGKSVSNSEPSNESPIH